MRCTSLAPALILLVASLACGGDPSADEGAATSSESGDATETGETGEPIDPICEATEGLFLNLTGPYGADSPTSAPLLQALQYESTTGDTGRASDCPCGSDCMSPGIFEFSMLGLQSLPSCFTVEYAVRADDANEAAWIVFRNANEGSAGQLVLAAGTDPASIPPSLSGFTVESAGLTECGDFAALRLRFGWGEASVALENGESGELETPMGTMTIYNRGSRDIYQGLELYGWIMVPSGTVLGG